MLHGRALRRLPILAALALPGAALSQQIHLGVELQVNTYTTSTQNEPSVAADDDGSFVVAWQSFDQDGSSRSIFAQRFSSAGTPLATELQVSTYTTGTQGLPSVAMTGAGDFLVVWESEQDGSASGVFARRFSSAGTPLAAEFQVNTYTVQNQYRASVAVDDDGDFVVAWQSFGQDGDGSGVFARRFSSDGTPLTAELQVNTYTTFAQAGLSVTSDDDGDFVVAWQSVGQDGSESAVLARRFSSDGTPLATEFQVNTYTEGGQNRPSVAAEGDGDFVVAWTSSSQDGDSDGIFAQRFSSAGTPLAAEFQVNTYTTADQDSPSVAAARDGDFVIAWVTQNGQDGSESGVFARRFSSAGTPLATEFQINTYTPSTQTQPSVAASPAGTFVVAFASYYQDGESYGIFAQRYAVPKVLDIDADGTVAPLSDGLLVLRYLFGFRGGTLVNGAVAMPGCNRCTAEEIEAYLATLI